MSDGRLEWTGIIERKLGNDDMKAVFPGFANNSQKYLGFLRV